MVLVYLFLSFFILIVSHQMIELVTMEVILLFLVIANLWFCYIFNSIIERKRNLLESKVSENGIVGARMTSIMFSIICSCVCVTPVYKSKMFYVIALITFVAIVICKKQVKDFFMRNHFTFQLYIIKIAIVLFVTSLFSCIMQVTGLLNDVTIVPFSKLSLYLCEVYFVIDILSMPRNSFLAVLSTRMYKWNPMVEEGNEFVK